MVDGSLIIDWCALVTFAISLRDMALISRNFVAGDGDSRRAGNV